MRTLTSAAAFLALLLSGPAFGAEVVSPMVVAALPAGDIVCASDNALARIKRIFGWTERTQWRRGFVISEIGNPRPSGHPNAEPGLVHRDYCMADAIMTDGTARPVYYVIEHGLGFVGIGKEVDFCIPGLDPWHVHDGDCRTVR